MPHIVAIGRDLNAVVEVVVVVVISMIISYHEVGIACIGMMHS